jgi:hypothetical protein
LARIRGTPARHRRYDLLIMNSIEPEPALEAAKRIDLPTLAVVHNAHLAGSDGPYATFLADPCHAPLFLGRHVGSQTAQDLPAWVAPVFLGEVRAEPDSADTRTVLCVQGNVDYARRDYSALLDAVAGVAADRSDFVVRIVGRSGGRDGRDLRAKVEDRALADRFTFNAGEVSHRTYLTQVGTADFILPLVDDRSPGPARYLADKITSSMSMSVGLGVIPIADARLAALYGVEDAAVCHGPGGLPGAIRTALDLVRADRARRVALLGRVRADLLAASVANLGSAIERLGVTR